MYIYPSYFFRNILSFGKWYVPEDCIYYIWAVLLVNDIGRPLIVYHDVVEREIGSKPIHWIWPCFNPDPNVCVSECAIPHYQSSCSFMDLPGLPTLIPCPGPQYTSVMLMFLLSCQRDTQSSPVPITELEISTPLECPMWIPSVLGLFFGAEMWRFLIFRL